MIDPKTLRIGNYILIKNEGRKPYYHELSGYDISKIEDYGEDFEGGNYPIPITIEILEKCGFVYNLYSEYRLRLDDYPFDLCYNISDELFLDIDLGYTWSKLKNVQYLHQLQNLFFALTGEELPITL